MKEKLKCLSEDTANELFESIPLNLERYKKGDFQDLSAVYGWSVELEMFVDLEPLKYLEGRHGQGSEVRNALLVWHALSSLSPSLACENRLWARISHLEGFNYARERWLDTSSDETVVKSVKDHFFADIRTKWRDDNALSRLWWSAYIAALAFPHDQKAALELILNKADIRSNFIERPQISSRPRLAAGILRIMMKDNWVTSKEENFRGFMKQVNKFGGGVLFEVWQESAIDDFMIQCASVAKSGVVQSA